MSAAVKRKNFELAASLRGDGFVRDWNMYKTWAKTSLLSHEVPDDATSIAVLNVGPPTPGMNSPVSMITRLATMHNYRVYGISEGCYGLWNGHFELLEWIDVDGWGNRGGVILGTNKKLPEKRLKECAEQLEENKIRALFIIGGWEAYDSLIKFAEASDEYAAFKIPIVVIPASIYNDCPCTCASIGADTAVNFILTSIDSVKQTATAIRRCVYIVEIEGRNCGYLGAAVSVSGERPSSSTSPERPISLSTSSSDVQFLTDRFKHSKTMALVLNSDVHNKTYTTETLEKIFNQEAKATSKPERSSSATPNKAAPRLPSTAFSATNSRTKRSPSSKTICPTAAPLLFTAPSL